MKTSDGSVIDVRRFGGCSKSDTRIYCLWNTYTTLKAIAGNWYIIGGTTNEE